MVFRVRARREEAQAVNTPNEIDEIERLGAMAERGEISEQDAAQQVMQVFDGGVTLTGARSLVKDWRTARAQYEQATRGPQ